jgi:hypothetical protein
MADKILLKLCASVGMSFARYSDYPNDIWCRKGYRFGCKKCRNNGNVKCSQYTNPTENKELI